MSKKGYKYLKYPSIRDNKDKFTNKTSSEQNIRLRAPCECGSGLSFKECCYRPDHRIFNLFRYFEKLKNIKLRIHDLIFIRFIEEYLQNSEIKKLADDLSDQLHIPDFQQLINQVNNNEEAYDDSMNIISSAIRFETLSIDRILPGHKKPILQEYLTFFLRKASKQERECYNSLVFSQFSFYEVIEVKKALDSPKNTWIMLQDLFTNEKYEMKDPKFTGIFHIWDVLVGRRYTINGFTLFSTAVFVISPPQQGAFNRILFLFWLKEKIAQDSNALPHIKAKYPQLFELFQNKHSTLQCKSFYTPELRDFLKENSPILAIIQGLLIEFDQNYPLTFKSPDNYRFMYAECVGKLDSNKIQEAVEILRKNSESFLEISDDKDLNVFKFDYLIPRNNDLCSEELMPVDFKFDKVGDLCNEAIVHQVLKALQKTLIVGATTIDLNGTNKQKVDSLNEIAESLLIRIGFLEINGNIIKFTTYSEESMQNLRSYLRHAFSSVLLELSFPQISDIQKEAHLKKTLHDNSFMDHDNIFNDDKVDDREENLNNDSDDEEDRDYISIVSRMLRRDTIKRWIHQKLPVLEGKSPKECVSDPRRYPILVDLIKDMENIDDKKGDYDPKHDYASLLGINLARNSQ